MSAETKLDRLNQLVDKLKEDLDRGRLKVSEASKTYVEHTKKTPDPLIHDGTVDQSQNPFSKSKGGGGGCTIL